MADLEETSERLHERVLVLRAQLGDRPAFHELVGLFEQRLAYYIQRMLHDWHQSRDILQQVWLDVFRTLPGLRSPKAFRVWLYRIAHDRVVTFIRHQLHESEAREQLAANSVNSEQWNDLELLENAELVHAALDKLSAAHREVMTLRFLEDMDVNEIARVTECSEGTAKSRLHYAKAAMRRIIEEEIGHA